MCEAVLHGQSAAALHGEILYGIKGWVFFGLCGYSLRAAGHGGLLCTSATPSQYCRMDERRVCPRSRQPKCLRAFQAGYEKGTTELLSALADANLIYEAAGMYGSLFAASKESFVLDNDLIGSVMRATRRFEVNDDALAFDVIRDVCLSGSGHFLGSDQTLGRMQSDYYYPAMADRATPGPVVKMRGCPS